MGDRGSGAWLGIAAPGIASSPVTVTFGVWTNLSTGKDIRIGGGPATIRQYVSAGLVDEIHLAVGTALLGRGEPLFTGLDLAKLGYRCAERACSDLATHLVLQR
jgi:dihydrofolate reductase